jgi:hypothetical protein
MDNIKFNMLLLVKSYGLEIIVCLIIMMITRLQILQKYFAQ